MKLSNESLKEKMFWEKANIALPLFDREAMIAATSASPKWIHFGAGNIFRAFPAALMQTLLENGLETTGIIVAEGYDGEIIDKCFEPFDNLSVLVTLKADGTAEKKVIGSVANALKIDASPDGNRNLSILKKIFASPSLQMASFTITEKGYNLLGKDGLFFTDIQEDILAGPAYPKSYLGRVSSLLYERYSNGALPIAMASMDNCSRNGEVLFNAIETIAKHWVTGGLISAGFLDYVRDERKTGFPWTMIDKITPGPDNGIQDMLSSYGLEGMQSVITKKKTYTAPFINAEETQYLVMEDSFPNGRPPLEKAGVLFTNRETVNKAEKMKVSACLNPLHTALAVFGCLLGYTRINREMEDADLVKLIEGVGNKEGLPVVTDPGIINPKDFLDQVINARLPNPFMPDSPQRIAADTSLKIPIRFGETIKAHIDKGKNPAELKFIPFVLAGWLRYLTGVDDNGKAFEVSPDPNYETLKSLINGKISQILSNSAYFGVDLYKAGLADKVEYYFAQMAQGPGSVRKALAQITKTG